MLHLSTDRLAALGDEQPTPAEASHLAVCAECARERDAYQTLVTMAQAERAPLGLPLTRWDALARALAAEEVPILAHRAARRRASRWPMQAAAGLLLLAGGAMLGRTSVGATPLPGDLPARVTASAPRPAATASSAGPAADSVFASVEEARAAQARSELLFQQAAAFLAEHDSTGAADGSPVAYRSRLAALDRVISTTREAMREAPHDPVINGYYLTTIGQREATLRQLNTALPASLRLNSF
jgi:predicted component of type VI protein secretion system